MKTKIFSTACNVYVWGAWRRRERRVSSCPPLPEVLPWRCECRQTYTSTGAAGYLCLGAGRREHSIAPVFVFTHRKRVLSPLRAGLCRGLRKGLHKPGEQAFRHFGENRRAVEGVPVGPGYTADSCWDGRAKVKAQGCCPAGLSVHARLCRGHAGVGPPPPLAAQA